MKFACLFMAHPVFLDCCNYLFQILFVTVNFIALRDSCLLVMNRKTILFIQTNLYESNNRVVVNNNGVVDWKVRFVPPRHFLIVKKG